MKPGKLFLIPCTLGEPKLEDVIPRLVMDTIHELDYFVVEKVRTARRFIRQVSKEKNIDNITFLEMGKHTTDQEISDYIKFLKDGKDLGILSEAGVPGIADPGSVLVKMAHANKVQVVPLTGPSSIMLAIMAAGLNGQRFRFHGYLPINKPDRVKAIQLMEKESSKYNETQVFIETPYRNMALLQDLLAGLNNKTRLCIAADITLPSEFIVTRGVGEWKNAKLDLHKRPAVFLFLAG
jgi:16S rRNA (cytidine1402-2'-O)-methyltransferase